VDSGGVTIGEVVTSGDEKGLRLLLASGADVNQTNKGGQTPLILAIVSGQVRLLPVLLKAGADPLSRDGTGLNAIEWAERKGLTDVLKQLITASSTDASSREQDRATTKRVAQEQAPASTPPDVSNKEGLSDVEKSRRWIAGMKQRLDEKATREQPSGFDTSREAVSPGSYDVAPFRSDDAAAEETAIARAESVEFGADQNNSDTVIPTDSSFELEPRRSSRKKCPQCNTVYNSDLIAYCAYHVVALVDIDTPVPVSRTDEIRTPFLWLLVVITFLGAALVGLYLFGPRSNQSRPASAPSSTPTLTMWKGTPVAEGQLKNKVVDLPPAETVLKIDKAETVVVHVRVDGNGRVLSVQSPPGNEQLRSAAMDAARKATFSAEQLRGRETVGTITYTFSP
jgi:TonB family protein